MAHKVKAHGTTDGALKRAAIYVRISRDKRKGSLEEGMGVADQERLCRELAERLGYAVVSVFVDNDKSAYSGKPRPAYLRMIDYLRANKADAVLCWHTDRLHRDNTELEDYIKIVESRDIRTDTVIGGLIDLNTPGGRANARFLCTVARLEVETRSERVKVARERQARQGKFGGGRRPYGFEADGVTIVESEAKVIRRCVKAVLSGVAIREIARDLRKEDIPTCDGKQWKAPHVRTILLRPRNAGLTVHRPDVRRRTPYTPDDVIGAFPGTPIIEPDEFWSVMHKLTDPDRRTTPGVAPKWLGSGIFRCPCGEPLRAQTKKETRKDRRTGEVTRAERQIYRCMSTDSGHVVCSRPELDRLVIATVAALIATSDPADIIGTPQNGVDVPALRAELVIHRAKLDEIAADYDDDVITKSQMITRTQKRRAKIEEVEAKLTEAAQSQSPAAKLIGAENIEAAWEALTLGEQREILRRLLVITVHPVGKGKRVAVRDRVEIRKNTLDPASVAA